ncbi:dienelactone hydrolase family protein [Pelagicoccus mobilis]|uniref:Dienelactone hydrolase family protein n=1 Tax=Pelagicoccus mobilis TaxID=415221 RepID=A0A934VUL9_9BACT|nr:PHB depolymerase family esterase [Pelagicoccus mobilis]MBK1880654.1 dienelactone hydrolase family protein [Pelagicoccus mobilis]
MLHLSFCLGQGRFVEQYSDFSADTLPGRLYIPGYNGTEEDPRPLIVALHGGGAIGSYNWKNVYDFDELFILARDRDAFIYAPQAVTAHWWVEGRHQAIIDMIKQAIETHHIDSTRVYLTGFSMGGGGTWDLFKAYPETFAAAIPICAISPRSGSDLSQLHGRPIWAFHARNDSIVSYSNTRTQINRILDSQNQPRPEYSNTGNFEYTSTSKQLKYTEYPDGDHFIWPRVYSTDKVINWMFEQQLHSSENKFSITSLRVDHTKNALSLNLSINSEGGSILKESRDLINWQNVDVNFGDSNEIVLERTTVPVFFRVTQ